ncbi:TMV resistance protein N-like protein isoform X1 [Tanacetum coccineum]
MAASSSSSSPSSHLITRSSFKSWNYEVFLSFRGEDTRKTFVDHLYTSLVQHGIHTYKDDETLPRGESIGPALLKAIRESQIAVIVFSENYADSSWCLDELAYIMECMGTRRQIVMPVFYDVDPSDVRRQKGKYGEAFSKHQSENNNKVESWRKALAAAGNLSGWVPKDYANGHEAKCIKDIVRSISNKLNSLSSEVSKDLIGIETRLQDLKSKLETGASGGVRIVGIWGVGGGGKTTLAYAAYTEMSVHFEGLCFLENVREESSKHGLKMLQKNVGIKLAFLKLLQKNNVTTGRNKANAWFFLLTIILEDNFNIHIASAFKGKLARK